MRLFFLTFITIAGLSLSHSARAQEEANQEIESSRYVRRAKPQPEVSAKPKPKAHKRSVASEPARPAPTPEASEGSLVPAPTLSSLKGQEAPATAANVENYKSDVVPKEKDSTGKSEGSGGVGSALRDTVLGGDLKEINDFRAALDPDDVRKNIFDISLATSYLYNASQSPYAPRSYYSSSPAGAVGLDLWLTPFLGLSSDYRFSQLNQMQDSYTADSYVPATHSWFSVGLEFRRFFGISSNAPMLSLGFKYADYTLNIPGSGRYFSKLATTGPEISAKVWIPSSKNFSWVLGALVQPANRHEESATSTVYKTGQDHQANAIGALIGGEYKMSRHVRFFTEFSAISYRYQFSGVTEMNDPLTTQQQRNVPVTNTFLFLDIGLRLGR